MSKKSGENEEVKKIQKPYCADIFNKKIQSAPKLPKNAVKS